MEDRVYIVTAYCKHTDKYKGITVCSTEEAAKKYVTKQLDIRYNRNNFYFVVNEYEVYGEPFGAKSIIVPPEGYTGELEGGLSIIEFKCPKCNKE